MKVKTNPSKYGNGLYALHKVDETGRVAQKDEERIRQANEEKEICLNCTKKKCMGTKRCFDKERNKHD